MEHREVGEKFKMENSCLAHHGIKGMKWGIRRYQRKDGTLTDAGRKRYNKEMESIRAERKVVANQKSTQKKLNRLSSARDKLNAEKQELEELRGTKKTKEEAPKQKSIKEMTNRELEDAIYRTQLEQRYTALHPQEVSAGKQFIQKYGPQIAERAWNDVGKKIVLDTVEKKLGIKSEDTSAALEKAAKDMQNKMKIAKGEDWFKERAEKQKSSSSSKSDTTNDISGTSQSSKGSSSKSESGSGSSSNSSSSSNSGSKTETYTGTVEGQGTSRRTQRDGPIFDAEYTEVRNSAYTDNGRDYATRYLETSPVLYLEDRSGR